MRAARQEELEVARSAAGEFAADTGLPADPGELAAVGTGLGDYRVALAALWPAAEAFQAARRHADEATEELAETQATPDRGRRAGRVRPGRRRPPPRRCTRSCWRPPAPRSRS